MTGVRLAGGERIAADVVVSNADVLRTHELVGRRAPRRRLRETMSCFLLYLGTRPARSSALLHHTLLVGDGYREFIRAVTRGRELPRTFSTYVHAPARTEPAMAPAGRRLARGPAAGAQPARGDRLGPRGRPAARRAARRPRGELRAGRARATPSSSSTG